MDAYVHAIAHTYNRKRAMVYVGIKLYMHIFISKPTIVFFIILSQSAKAKVRATPPKTIFHIPAPVVEAALVFVAAARAVLVELESAATNPVVLGAPVCDVLTTEVVSVVCARVAEGDVVTATCVVLFATGAATAEPPLMTGGGTTSEGSSSAPTPHGMLEPSGWTLSAGGVVLPPSSAMVKRVVQVLDALVGLVNW